MVRLSVVYSANLAGSVVAGTHGAGSPSLQTPAAGDSGKPTGGTYAKPLVSFAVVGISEVSGAFVKLAGDP